MDGYLGRLGTTVILVAGMAQDYSGLLLYIHIAQDGLYLFTGIH
jgi:hypothetical protein